MSDDYTEKLQKLTNKVDEITSVKQKSFIPVNINPLYIYIAIPVIIFFILLIAKPKIFTTQIKDDKTFFIENKISYIKILFVILFVIITEVVIYFIFNVKKK